jgi:HEXXH motif-containing protein
VTTGVHELDPILFDRLAGGLGGPEAIEALRAAQLSKHLQLMAYLLNNWPGTAAERDTVAEALDRARSRSPQRFGDVVGAPLVGAWTAIVGRAVDQGRGTPDDLRHLNTIAMVACAAAGVDAEAGVPVRDGLVALPGLGAAVVHAADARLAVRSGHLAVHAGGATIDVPDDGDESEVWFAVRRLVGDAAGLRLRLDLDDLDPYRHGHHVPPASRLPAAEVDAWRELFSAAWRLLAAHLPTRAAEMTAGLRTLVPLARPDDRSARSATLRHAFGVFGLTLPPSPAEFAVTLVHEFQHSKLSAVLDLVPLSDPDDDRRYFAPWRTDPRPLPGLLQGVYAFVGVADAWRALRDAEDLGPLAEKEFAYARLQVHAGLTAVENCDALTSAGHTVVSGLRAATDRLLAEPVAPSAAAAAEDVLARIRDQWSRRHAVMS